MNIEKEKVKIIKDFLIEEISPTFIFLFGSAVQGNFTETSDVDIAFLSDEENNSYETFMIAQKLSTILKRDVDLIDLKESSTVLKAQICGKGQIIYSTNKESGSEFIVQALSQYAQLNQDRKEVLGRIKEEGKIYE